MINLIKEELARRQLLSTQSSHSDWKTSENGKAFPVMEKSGNLYNRLEKSGQNHTKYWKTWRISDQCYF